VYPQSFVMLARLAGTLSLVLTLTGCAGLFRGGETAPTAPPEEEGPPLPVKKVEEEIVVAAWAEPSHLPEGGGIAQILVRVQKRGGAPFAGVEVRLSASRGTLYSKSAVLVTDGRGMTRDRLSTRDASTITLNAGGTRYTFRVPLGPAPATK